MPTDATATIARPASPSRRTTAPSRPALLENYFYFLMTLLIAGIVVYGCSHHVRWHRRVGVFGAGLGALIPVLGVATAITMGRFNLLHLHQAGAAAFLIIPLWDMATFTPAFALAVYWRKKPEFHRRLILIACCALTAASFGRFPPNILPRIVFYAGVDFLILLGVVRDLI